MKGLRFPILVAVTLVALLLATSAWATPIQLTDKNSIVRINPDSSNGMYDWVVNGVDQMFQQWFWYRIGDSAEQPLNQLGLVSQDSSNRLATLVYGSAQGLTIQVDYLLTGTLQRQSDVAETITLTNGSSRALDLHFFQYSDFDLNGWPSGQSVEWLNTNTVRQTGHGVYFNETVITPAANHWEMNYYANTINKLSDGLPTTLNDQKYAGPGDVTWAYQWDFTLAAGTSMQISKDKRISDIPEPFTLALVGSGLLVLGWFKRRTIV